MAMLITRFHKLIQSKVLWYIILGVIIVSFVGFFMPTNRAGARVRDVPSAGELFGKKVSQDEYHRAYNNTYIWYIISSGKMIPMTDELTAALREEAWRRVAVLRKAQAEKIPVTDKELIQQVQTMPLFHAENGAFDPRVYKAVLQQLGISPRQAEELFREQITIYKLMYRPVQAALISPYELKQAYHLYTDRFVLDYVLIPRAQVEKTVKVTKEAAQALFAENPEAFRMPAKVRVSYVEFPVSNFVASAEVPEGAALQVYNKNIEDYRVENTNANAIVEYKPFEKVEGEINEQIRHMAARKLAVGELQTTWFERHGSTPITELPADWPEDYKRLVERRIELIETDHNIGLIEQPEYKRRWNTEPWESQLERALREWLLDRLESYFDFDGRMSVVSCQLSVAEDQKPRTTDQGPRTSPPLAEVQLLTVSRLADVARQDADFMQVGEVYRDDRAFNVDRLVAELVEAESVPLLPILRYKPSGLRKRAEWEQTWELQREEDRLTQRREDGKKNGEDLGAFAPLRDIPVPPKYTSADFLKSSYWRLRGKLDVPKERWVSFPHCEGPDGTLVIAWAGYDHLQLARSISAYYVDIQDRLGGRDDPRLVPLLACLLELLPWLKQWHNEVDPEFGERMGDYFQGYVNEEARQLGKTIPEIRAWEPLKKTGGRKKK